MDSNSLKEATQKYLKEVISGAANNAGLKLDASTSFGETGINSFHVLKIIKKLESDFGYLPKTLLFEKFNIEDLSTYFFDHHRATLEKLFDHKTASNNAAAAEMAPTDVSELSTKSSTIALTKTATLIPASELPSYPALESKLNAIFLAHRNETSVSRGTKNIAPYLFIGAEERGYFNVNLHKTILLVYAYTGPQEYLSELSAEILRYCEEQGYELNLFSDTALTYVGSVPFTATPFGVIQQICNLREFTLEGGPMRRLRYQVTKFEKNGNCRTVEYRCGSDKAIDQQIANIIDAWCQPRTMVNPLIYLVKEEILNGRLDEQHRLFLTYLDDVLQNVILISAMSNAENGYLMDLEFYPPDMPLGGLEFAIVSMIAILVAEGCNMLSLGGTYGCKLESSSNADPGLDKTLDELRELNVFNDEGNLQFKNKFRPVNTTIYLCRPEYCKNYENIIDLIMMIADPSAVQGDIKLLRPASTTLRSDSIDQQKSALPAQVPPTSLSGHNTTPDTPRLQFFADLGYNVLRLGHEQVSLDLKTDSWAQLAMPAIKQHMTTLQRLLQKPLDVEAVLKEIFPFKHFVMTTNGRSAESVLAQALPRKGKALQNRLFPTWIFSEIEHGFEPLELAANAIESEQLNKAHIDLNLMLEQLEKQTDEVAMVCLELSCNACGGLPLALEHLREVKQQLQRHKLPLVLDATRVLDNAYRLLADESGSRLDLWEMTKALLATADVITVSLAKNFCVDRGGLIATNDGELFKTIKAIALDQGSALDVLDRKLVAVALQNKVMIQRAIHERAQLTHSVASQLLAHNFPVITPVGQHCILLDCKRLPPFSDFACPAESFTAWLYLNTGIRSSVHNTGLNKAESTSGVVRLALPLGLSVSQANTMVEWINSAYLKCVNVPEIIPDKTITNEAGEAITAFKLITLHHPGAYLPHVNVSDSSVVSHVALTPAMAKPSQSLVTANVPAQSQQRQIDRPEPIAIIGMAGRYPDAHDLDQFWDNLRQGRDSIRELPDERFNMRRQRGLSKRYRGGFIDGFDRFDSLFFSIAPREAETIDPQERLLLEVAWEVLEDSGYSPEALTHADGSRRVGVYVGAVWTMYQTLGAEERMLGTDCITNSFLWSIANRVSYCLNLTGPSMTVDTACSASLTALHLACEAIRNGECESAIVGGVNLDVHQAKFEMTYAGGALSEDGICRTFGKDANGYVAGEGVGAILIKPLSLAERDGDHIYGVIKSSAINHGGKTSGFSVPNPKAHSDLISLALKRAAVDPATIGYIEAHGTGTELGDPIEIAGLNAAFEQGSVAKQSCAIGSVKTNIGHLEAAAGIVGITKVLLQMTHRELVPSLHSTELNDHIDFAQSYFSVQQTLQPWQRKQIAGVSYPLRAGVSSFGAGGSNAHVILEEYCAPISCNQQESDPRDHIIVLSARTEEQLKQAALKLSSKVQRLLALNHAQSGELLRDIAYTLILGRKVFEYRVAVLAGNLVDLKEKLTLFAQQNAAPGVLSGNAKAVESVSKLLNKTEKDDLVRLLAQSPDLSRLAQAWVEGLVPDLHYYAKLRGGKKCSLPTYPFAEKRHWIGSGKDSRQMSAQARLHPMLDSNESTFQRQIFKKRFTAQEFFIYDHLVSTIPTLPGVGYLDFARKAGELSTGKRVSKIKNIVWLSPIAVDSASSLDVYLELKPKDDVVNFDVFSLKADGKQQLHAQGKLLFASDADSAPQDEYIDLDAIKSRTQRVIGGAEAYPLFDSLGLHLGPTFQVLQEVFKNTEEVLGVLKAPGLLDSEFDQFLLHPSLVDGAFQAFMGAQLAGVSGGGMVVPYSLGEVEIRHPLSKTCFSYVTDAGDGKKSAQNLSKKNVWIVDETGRVLVKISDSVGVPLTDVHEKKQHSNEGRDPEFSTLTYRTEWSVAALPSATAMLAKSLLLFSLDDSLVVEHRARLADKQSRFTSIIWVTPGDAYEQIEADHYRIRANNEDDIAHLFDALRSQGRSVEAICFNWAEQLSYADIVHNDETPALQGALHKGVYSFLALCRVLIERKLDGKVSVLHLHAQSDIHALPHNEALNGFITILNAEASKMRCKTLAVSSLSSDQLYTVVADEIGHLSSNEMMVRYDSANHRLVRSIKEFELQTNIAQTDESVVAIKQRGIYIITGGAGGLGLLFAEHLMRHYAARVVLTGRSPLSESLTEKLNALSANGGEWVYLSADISRATDVATLVQDTLARYGAINGIIHSAGVLRDAYIRNKTAAEMDAVFAPKINGTVHLDHATKDLDLDFFVMFSSLAAMAGNVGQSDYAYANHFMDSFAHLRDRWCQSGSRRGKTISFNWSLWADGGMQLDEQTSQFFKRTLGINPLSKETGIRYLLAGLLSPSVNFAVIEGVKEKIERTWGIQEAVHSPVVETKPSTPVTEPTPILPQQASVIKSVQHALSVIVVDFLKLEMSEIDLDSILLDLGFDSIGLSTFANAVNDKYGTDLTPVVFFEYPNIRQIADYLVENHADKISRQHPTGAVQGSRVAEPAPVATRAAESRASGDAIVFDKQWRPEASTNTAAAAFESASSFVENRFVRMPIAIVGAAGVMPQSDDLREYWQKLRDAENNMVTLVPEDRWSWQDYFGDPVTEDNKTNSKWGGFMREVDKFDPLFWGISPREAEMMDPQQRIFLETVWHAIEDSGHRVSELAGTRTGLFVGAATRDYIDLMGALDVVLDGYSASGTSHAILANRVSFLLDLHGPSAPIDTACSSSLVALHRAIESIHTGSCDMAIVGGVQVMLTPAAHISFGRAGMLANDGKCKTFDSRANGYVRGEGSGAIFIKPLAMAERDGDHIYAVIKSTAENHGGRATMLTAPNPNAQADLLIEAYEKAQVDPTTIGMIECHGTGTPLGDPIEIQAMKKAFTHLYAKHGKQKAPRPHIGLTSAKTNIGHLETAAGIAGLLKVIMAIKHKQIPALLHFEKQNPYINIDDTPFYLVDKTIPWPSIVDEEGRTLPRRAGLSSFGFGGANVHVVFEEYVNTAPMVNAQSGRRYPIVLSAKTTDSLRAYAKNMAVFLRENDVNLAEFAHTLQVGRDAMEHRLGFIADSMPTVIDVFEQFGAGTELRHPVLNGRVPSKKQTVSIDENTVQQWMASQDFDSLLQNWIKGLDIDWSKLNRDHRLQRLSLPTYPFARERYWFDIPDAASNVTNQSSHRAVLHPLLHENRSVLNHVCYQSVFSGKERFFIKTPSDEHSVTVSENTSVMSVAVYPDMLRVAVQHAVPDSEENSTLRLSSIHFGNAFPVRAHMPISVSLFENEQYEIECEVYTADSVVQSPSQFITVFECVAALEPAVSPRYLDLQQLSSQMTKMALKRDAIYQRLSAQGFEFHDEMKCMTSMQLGWEQSLLTLDVFADSDAELTTYRLHPGILESVFQGAAALLSDVCRDTRIRPIPISAESIVIAGHCASPMYAWIRIAHDDKHTVPAVNVDVFDVNGKVCITIGSLRFTQVGFASDEQSFASEFKQILEKLYDENERNDSGQVFTALLDKLI